MSNAMVTMQDIAAELDLSQSCVSYALGDKWKAKGIPPSTREQILAKARELGYRRNHIAVSLTRGSTKTIGLVIPALRDEMYEDLVRGINDAIGDDYALFLG